MKQPSRMHVLLLRWQLRRRLLRHGVWPLCLAWAALLCLLQSTTLGTYVDVNITHPFLFKMREALHRDPPLNRQLKIFSYDDGSVDRLQRADLTIDDWATVLTSIAARKPRVILIDKVFAIVFDPLSQKAEALAKLKAIGVPMVVGAFAVQDENRTRHPLDLSGSAYRLGSLLEHPQDMPPSYDEFKGWHVYGPHPDLQAVFAGAGHLLYPESGLVSAFLQPEPGVVVPHLALMAERRVYKHGDLYVNDHLLPLSRDGQLVVNFSRQDAYYARHKRLGTAVLAARRGEPLKSVEPGDTVLILPEMFTGSTDFKTTPIGILPGGFVLAALLNSVLSDAWIRLLPGVELQILALCLLGALAGNYRRSLRYWAGQVAAAGAIVAAGAYLFAFQATVVPVPAYLLAFLGTSLLVFADRNQKRESEARRVADELSDAVEMAKAFRPDTVPEWGFTDVAAYHCPYSEASGDWFAFSQGPSGRYHHFVLCDVTGHGVQAALMVSICKTVMALYTRDRKAAMDSSSFLQVYAHELNNMLCHHGHGQHLLTMLGVTFDPEEGKAYFLSAGHPPPVVYTASKPGAGRTIRHLALRSTVLGLVEDFSPRMRVQPLAAGDEIIAYTDGLPLGHYVRMLNQSLADERPVLANAPEELFKAVWATETRKTGRTLDDDVSIVWFRMSRKWGAAGEGEVPAAES